MSQATDRMPAEDLRAYQRGRRAGWVQAMVFYAILSGVAIAGFHALSTAVHP